MSKDYNDGYQAGLNEWAYDLTKINNKDYNEGWAKGWEKRKNCS